MYFDCVSLLGVMLLPIAVLAPDMLEAYFGQQRHEQEEALWEAQKAVPERLADHNFRRFELLRLICVSATAIASTALMLLALSQTEAPEGGFQAESETWIKRRLPATTTLAVGLSIKFYLTIKPGVVMPRLFEKVQLSLVAAASLFVVVSADAWLSLLMPVGLLLAKLLHRSQRHLALDCLQSFTQLIVVLHATVFIRQTFGLLDCIFAATLVFMHHVGKYRPGAVRLASLFRFL